MSCDVLTDYIECCFITPSCFFILLFCINNSNNNIDTALHSQKKSKRNCLFATYIDILENKSTK